MNDITILQSDLNIIKAHKQQFLKPLKIIMHLSTLNLTANEIINTKEFKQVVLQLKNIDKQGYKRQLILFCNLVLN